LRILLRLALAIFVCGAMGWWWFDGEVERRSTAPLNVIQPEVIEVARDSNLANLLDEMVKRNYTSSQWWIRRYAITNSVDKQLKVGEFRVLPGDSAATLLHRIVAGEVIRYRFTIIEGQTLAQVLGSLDSAQFQQTAGLTPENLSSHLYPRSESGPGVEKQTENLEGWLLPATYDYVRSDHDLDVLRRAHAAMEDELDRLWEGRSKDLPYATPYEALIMASIIEKETGVAAERPQIASVFVRRLKLGMMLQTDPTVIYGVGAQFDGNLTRKHLTTATPYNTYTMTGLPPTPISMPGSNALRAALQPAIADDLYFVGRGDGTSKFSRTLAEHNKAVEQYQRTPRTAGALQQ